MHATAEKIGMQGKADSKWLRAIHECGRTHDGNRLMLFVGMILLSCPAVGNAAEWSFDPAISAALGYESNVALTTVSHNSISEGVLVPGLTIRRLTETSAVNIGLLGRATYYSGSEFPDTYKAQVTLSSFVQSTERTKFGLDAVSRWDTLFQSSVLGTGTGNIQDVDIGLVTTAVRREWREVRPSVTYALTERSSVRFLYRLTDVQFGSVGTTGLVDYQQNYLSGTYSYRLTPTDDLNLVAVGANYHPSKGTDSDTVEILAGITHRFSETANAGLRAGAGKTTETMSDGSHVGTSLFVLEARGSERSELSRLEAAISRNVQPSGSGRSVSADQLRVDWSRKLSETMGSLLRSTVFRNKSLQGSDPLVDRRYVEASAGVNWIVAPEWSVGVAYQYRYQKYDAAVDSARSSGVFVAVNWAPPRRR
jgi:hypothetical protein